MANQDNEFNFYNSENDGYRGGFGGYTDSNPNQSQGGPEAPQGPQKHRGSGRRIAALILACAVVGGGAGVGGAALYSSVFASQPSVIYQNTQPISTQADPVASSSGQAMTPEQLYAANVDACVGITVSTTMTNIFGYTSTSAASGSGFVITADGYIVTNYHVIEDAVKDSSVSITVSFHDGSSYPATLVGGEEDNDVAVLKIEASGLQTVTLGDSDQLKVGQAVMAIGNPLGELTYSLTDGLISALDRLITTGSGNDSTTMNMLQTNCAINPGNSGGPLFNSYGEVIGITTAKYSTSSSGTNVEGLGFAIPINDVKNIISDLIQYGYVTGKPYMGITGVTMSASVAQQYGVTNAVLGVYVATVEDGSCSAKAGLQPGDIITAMDEDDVVTFQDLEAAKATHQAGDTVTLTVFRNGEKLELSLTLDLRWPVTARYEDFADRLMGAMERGGFAGERTEGQDSIYMPPESPLVQALSKVYREQTGQEAELLSIGGGTYAKACPNLVAFGPLFPGQEMTEHQPDEYMEADTLLKNAQMMAAAIWELAR